MEGATVCTTSLARPLVRVATDASRIVVAADRRVKTTSPLSDGLKGVFHADWHRLLPLTVFEPCRAT
jgi:hypothetical protein